MSEIDCNIILASNSPRRKELLQALNFNFKVERFDFTEDIPTSILPSHAALYITESKMKQIDMVEGMIYITADTTVVVDNVVLGKPKDQEEAMQMLAQLSGNTHSVISGVAIGKDNDILNSFQDETRVTFRTLSKEEMEYYIANYSPFDKAGAYGIQEWIGMIGITKIEGSYYNVMGLPTNKLNEALINLTTL